MSPDESTRIHDRIDRAVEKTEKAVEKIEVAAQKMATIEASCPFHAERLVNVEQSVFGNGRTGLMTRVDRLEQKARAVWAIIGGAVALVGAGFGALGTWLAK